MDILNVCINLHTAVEALSDTRESSRSGLQASWTWKKSRRTQHKMKRIKLLLPGPALSFGLDTCSKLKSLEQGFLSRQEDLEELGSLISFANLEHVVKLAPESS